ncbi:MAG: hypothetical protein ACREO5_07200 [Candidatus Binatia bacterium]
MRHDDLLYDKSPILLPPAFVVVNIPKTLAGSGKPIPLSRTSNTIECVD